MTVRKCGTCKHYEPAPIWRKGWCRNPLLYSPQQSHLVGEDDLDCDRGMGNYWEAIEVSGPPYAHTVESYGYVAPTEPANAEQETTGEAVPIHLSVRDGENGESLRRGGPVSQFGGSGRPGGPGGFGNGDDDRGQPPFDDPEANDPDRYGSERSFDYQVEERYWTDYLRIAAPVLGVILMLGLVWFWIVNLLGDDDNADEPTPTPEVSGPAIFDDTPTPDDDADTDNGAVPVTTPTPETDGEDAPPATIAPGAVVVVANTDGEGLNVRAEPSTEADIQAEVPEGTQLTITGEAVEGEGFIWWPVEGEDVTGYVAEDFIELSQ